jgi:hypothetical protein
MAKQPQLTVNVNSQQFQNFAKQFGAFSTQIKTLNSNFAQINASLNKSNVMVRALQSSMTGLLSVTKSVGSEVWKITKQFVSWGAIIGGVTALLGMGGGLFGIERLAASIMQKRRMTMGLGGDYGRVQAQSILQQGTIGSPTDIMKNIALGKAGSGDQLKALMGLGIPFGTKQSPEELMDTIVAKLPSILNRAGPGKELMMAQAFGLDKLFTDPFDMLRLATKEGQKEYQEKKKLVDQYKDLLKITPRAQRAWTELELQFQAAKAQLESIFGEKLADLAAPLKHLSESFAHLIRVLMDSPVIQRIIKRLAGWIDELAKKMSKLTEKDIEEFIKKIEAWLPTMEQFKTAMKDFVEILQGAVKLFGWLKYFGKSEDQVKQTYQEKMGMIKPGEQPKPSIFDWLRGRTPHVGPPTAQSPSTTTPSTVPSTTAPSTAAPSAPGGGFGAGASPFQGFGGLGGGFKGGASAPRGGGGGGAPNWMTTIPGMTPKGGAFPSVPAPAAATAAPTAPPANSATPSFGDRFGTWPSAAQKMTPKPQGGGGGGLFGKLPSVMGSDPGLKAPGPLSMNNWQMNRTANLVVRNVPGANVFMTAAGMTG